MGSTEVKTVAEFLVADFEREMQTTLRVLETVPNGRLDYQPDAKAKTGLGLVRHIALEDSWLLNGIADGTFRKLSAFEWRSSACETEQQKQERLEQLEWAAGVSFRIPNVAELKATHVLGTTIPLPVGAVKP